MAVCCYYYIFYYYKRFEKSILTMIFNNFQNKNSSYKDIFIEKKTIV